MVSVSLLIIFFVGSFQEAFFHSPGCGKPSPDCGKTYGNFPPGSEHEQGHLARIIYGKYSRVGDWPWIVQLHADNSGYCTGTIISPRFILTAEHCTWFITQKDYVTAHTRTVYSNEGNAVNVRRIIHYEDEGPPPPPFTWPLPNDLSILELEEPLTFNKNVSSICLPKNFDDYADQPAFIAGFGRNWDPNIEDDSIDEGRLRHDEQYICAGARNEGSTHGDSGGPLMVSSRIETELEKAEGRWFIVGIVSAGSFSNANNSGWPGSGEDPWDHVIYTRVNKYCEWIYRVTEGEAECI
uniref:Peptidase S1 domain-containing protein n=1 Tax=Acrobeloides nanus TaxID=290746 RepID=A0A914DG45_9BILA